MITVGTKAGCSRCYEIKAQLDVAGLEYEECDVEHDTLDWRTDGSVEILAAVQMADGLLPIVKIDDEWMSAKEAMGELGLAPKARFGSWRLKGSE